MSTQTVPVNVYAEMTPNPATMKYVADRLMVPEGVVVEFNDPSEVKDAPLAAKLFNFPFVDSLFFAGNFVTVTKNDLVEWEDVNLEMRTFIREHIAAGHPTFTKTPDSIKREDAEGRVIAPPTEVMPQNETEEKIVEVLEEYVRPAVENDGGAIHFKSFADGILTVVLRGACSGCPSSMITLKGGIEGLMQRMVPAVKEVVAEEQ